MLFSNRRCRLIGSNLVAALNEAGRDDVVVCDVLGTRGQMAQSRQNANFPTSCRLLN